MDKIPNDVMSTKDTYYAASKTIIEFICNVTDIVYSKLFCLVR